MSSPYSDGVWLPPLGLAPYILAPSISSSEIMLGMGDPGDGLGGKGVLTAVVYALRELGDRGIWPANRLCVGLCPPKYEFPVSCTLNRPPVGLCPCGLGWLECVVRLVLIVKGWRDVEGLSVHDRIRMAFGSRETWYILEDDQVRIWCQNYQESSAQ